MKLAMTAEEVNAFLAEVFPQTADAFRCTLLEPLRARVELIAGEVHLRPGGTVSGPTMFTLADCGFYMAVLGMIGREALTVTTNASIDFMRKPGPGAMWADVTIHKFGRVLVVGDVLIYSEGIDAVVARASLTYSIPPKTV